MAESRKETPSSVDSKEKKSLFDDEIGKQFFGSWKLPSVAGDDTMDFSFDSVSTGKEKSFKFGKLDLDFDVDGDFNKSTSFKGDMPDLDFSSPSKKTAKPKESSKGESSGGSHQGKHDNFNFSFDFNEMDDFNFGSPSKEGKKISEKNSNIKDDGAARIEQQGSKLNMAGYSEAFDDCQTDKLPASDNATAPTMETTIDCSGTLDASNIGELVLTHKAQTSPQKSHSVSPKDEDQQIYLEEKEKSTEPVARDTTQDLPAQSFDGNNSTQATESDTETDTPAPEVNTESATEQSVTDRKIDVLRSDPDNSQLKISDPPHNNESGSKGAESEKADSETLAGNMIGTAPMQDDLDGEVTSAATLSRTRSHSDASKDIQRTASILLAPLSSEHVVDKVIPIKENAPEVGSSKLSQRSNEAEALLCQPSSVGGEVSSAVNKGLATSYPANGKREGIFVNDAETPKKLTGDLKSMSKELAKGEPAFLGSKNNAKDLCNIREGFNGDRMKSISRHPDKEATKGDSILLGNGMNNKDLNNFDGNINLASSTHKATKSNTQTSVDSTTVISNMISTMNLKIGSSEGLKTTRRTLDISSLKISSGNVNPAGSTYNATKSNTHRRVDSKTVVSSTISTRNVKIGSSEGLKTGNRTPDLSSLKISRSIGVSRDPSDATLGRELSSLRKSEKDTEVQGSTASKIVHSIERKTSPITCLKRKTSETSNANQVLLHPQKRLSQSPSESRNVKEPLERTEVQCNQPENDTQTMLYNQPTSGLKIPNAKEDSTFLTMENDQNVEKAEGYAKDLDDMCNMLKKKYEEAKGLLVRAIVNNNYLLILKGDAKISLYYVFIVILFSSCSDFLF
ncbi:uncharacterized protein At4g18490-like [Euphorbia lathyris]|uniref:uncharacterized protein At4g18490-like n=1 Tax=Euphorbia lathyris TaxID=212925 RepID=UPI003313AE94